MKIRCSYLEKRFVLRILDELTFLVNAILVKYQQPAELPIKTQEILRRNLH